MRESLTWRPGQSSDLFLLAVLVIGLSGCGGPSGLPNMVPIRGTVSFRGELLKEGTGLYVPKGQGGRQARGDIQPDGSFRLTTLRKKDGAQKGAYNIIVIAMAPHPGEPPSREEIEAAGGMIRREYVVPERFTSPETSGLSDTVDDNHSGVMDIVLTE